mgnify:CR=1 FL=1
MRQLFFLTLCFFLQISVFSQAKYPLEVKTFKLNNGLTVWLNEDHSQPKIFGAVLVKAGAKDCPNTGIAHYFEHMMFKGTEKIGTVDYTVEKVLLDSIAVKYDELAATSDKEERSLIQKEINRLTVRSAAYVIPNEFDRLIAEYGGSDLNAATSYDYTVYHNIFSPQYIRQWAELNSERLIDPVFRLFQSELETIYEEKNMYDDFIGSQTLEKVTERFFAPNPYAYPLVGSTENLKNPRLSEMKKFFDTYYVAGNMGLILCGDFHSEEVIPVLEGTFGRIRQGNAPERQIPAPAPFNGRETFKAKLPIPLLKAEALCWRGVPANHPDEIKLDIATGLLSNSNHTGYLDQLTVDGRLMEAEAFSESLNDAGVVAILIVPRLVVQSYNKAKSLVMHELDRIKKGDFTDEAFNSLKLEQKRNYEKELEDIDSRSEKMLDLFSEGKDWNSYLDEIKTIDAITKDDVVKAASKYFTGDYLDVTKKTGNYPKNTLQKPGFKPVVPKNAEAKSEYAKKLEKIPVLQSQPRFLDFEKDVETVQLAPKATLYVTPNAVNTIFTLDIDFQKGTLESKLLEPMTSYLGLLGTDSLSYIQLKKQLQDLGSSMSFDAENDKFTIHLSGFDTNFEKTLVIAGNFIKHVKNDPSKMKQVTDAAKVEKRALKKSADDMAYALLEKVRYGDRSVYLNCLSVSEIKKLKGSDLLAEFKEITGVECDLHYCGNLPAGEVASAIKRNIDTEAIHTSSDNPVYREPALCNQPTVYFIDMPKSSQSIIYEYMPGDEDLPLKSRYGGTLFNNYFGGDMSSIVFQQIREFRSLAYRVNGKYLLAPYKHRDRRGQFVTMLSTQCDKTTDALTVLDSLIHEMPEKAERVDIARQSIKNEINNDYPSFREKSEEIASLKREGYTADPNKNLLDAVSGMDVTNISDFYRKNIKGRPYAYIVVGNEKQIDMKKLATFGTIIKVKPEDVYR